MRDELTELILEDDGFKIKETKQPVRVTGGRNLEYTGILHKKGEKMAKADDEIRYAICDVHNISGKFNGFHIVHSKTDPKTREWPLEDQQGKVIYQALQYGIQE